MAEPISSRTRHSARAASSTLAHGRADRTALAAVRGAPQWHYLAALALGAANTLSFAPTRAGGWLELVLFMLFYGCLVRTSHWKSAALTGGAFGFGNFVTGVWWLYVSMHDYGGMPAPLAIAALVLFSAYLALYPALAAGIWSVSTSRSHRRGTEPALAPSWHTAFAFASAWALAEWLRGTIFTGFPWLASGYAQVDGPLAGFAPLAGVYGVGWAVAWVAALSVQAIYRFVSSRARHVEAEEATNATNALKPALTVLALVAGGMAFSQIAWTRPDGAPLSARILQGNVKQEMKFDEAGVAAAIARYEKMITAKPADLVVTPETAIPLLPQQFPEPFGRAVRQFADRTGSSILLGAFGAKIAPDGEITEPTNSLIGVTPNSAVLYRYDKHHLVPFGEFVPWGFHWFVRLMNIPLGDLASGKPVQPPFQVRQQTVDVDICYEDIFGEEIARRLREAATPASVLVNVSNLAWFGKTIALDQHLQMARMRTLETGRPLLAATNTGATASIDSKGRVAARLPVLTVGALDVQVQGMTGTTPYIATGNVAVLAASLVLLALCAAFARRRI